ncbi:hypothetical protein D3Z36_13565 [Lachnospiraceae bacterium]|nr:hypothetical protein [Lachnospiraceae bacterium]
MNKISILFVCQGSTAGSREMAALVGQNGANRGIGERGVLRFTTNGESKTEGVEILKVNNKKEI